MSNTASSVLCDLHRLRDHHNVQHYSQNLKISRVRQVVLDKWFPLRSGIIGNRVDIGTQHRNLCRRWCASTSCICTIPCTMTYHGTWARIVVHSMVVLLLLLRCSVYCGTHHGITYIWRMRSRVASFCITRSKTNGTEVARQMVRYVYTL